MVVAKSAITTKKATADIYSVVAYILFICF